MLATLSRLQSTGERPLNIRRLVLDVDKARARPSLLEIGEAIAGCAGVQAFNLTVGEIDIETVGMDITIEGENLSYEQIASAIDSTGAVVHSIDQLVAGDRVIEGVARLR
jgi:hypothetical protein